MTSCMNIAYTKQPKSSLTKVIWQAVVEPLKKQSDGLMINIWLDLGWRQNLKRIFVNFVFKFESEKI